MHWLKQSARDFPPAISADGVRQQNVDKSFFSVFIIYPVQTV